MEGLMDRESRYLNPEKKGKLEENNDVSGRGALVYFVSFRPRLLYLWLTLLITDSPLHSRYCNLSIQTYLFLIENEWTSCSGTESAFKSVLTSGIIIFLLVVGRGTVGIIDVSTSEGTRRINLQRSLGLYSR